MLELMEIKTQDSNETSYCFIFTVKESLNINKVYSKKKKSLEYYLEIDHSTSHVESKINRPSSA